MVFRRLFERREAAPTEAPSAAAADVEDETAVDEKVVDDAAPEDVADVDWRDRAARWMPTGASTGSKRAEALYGSADAAGPTHFARAMGCRVVDAAGATYVDCTMALGAVALGYAEQRVTHAVVEAAAAGNVAGLSSVREVELAERLCSVIPCAEQIQFLKTGAEAVAAVVRLARTYTGRDVVVSSGYFGWLDWASDARGVPSGVRRDVRRVPFDDVGALERAVAEAGARLAAVVIEPVIERLPSADWIARARALCDETGAALIFDEIKTGFRLRPGGYQELAGVTPDLATFGKALANGYPLSVVGGRRDLMLAARDTWISSTLASESTALAAAWAVLDWHDQADICEALATTGRDLRDGVRVAIDASGIGGVTVDGIDPMWLIRFDDPKRETRFLELAAQEGVLFKRGAYNYASVAHDEETIREVEAAASAAFVALRDEEQASE
ncbi:MAG: aminotransferase class III-fold pyridoxal phosphate-dependent enzyme [Gemmatimonadaceae bacterium]